MIYANESGRTWLDCFETSPILVSIFRWTITFSWVIPYTRAIRIMASSCCFYTTTSS